MKEFIVDFELYGQDGKVLEWMQNAFVVTDDVEEIKGGDLVKSSLFEHFMDYAEEFWGVSADTPIRITKVWTLEV